MAILSKVSLVFAVLLFASSTVTGLEEVSVAGDDRFPASSCEEWAAFTDSEAKSLMWGGMKTHDTKYLSRLLQHQPCAAKARAGDGRGPLFWANEFGLVKVAEQLIQLGADPNAKDDQGYTPSDLFTEEYGYEYALDDDEYEDDEYDEDDYAEGDYEDDDYQETEEGKAELR